MKQTAVEWLIENLPYPLTLNEEGLKKIEQAKSMEKEQIVDAYWYGEDEYYPEIDTIKVTKAEQYYNETYGK